MLIIQTFRLRNEIHNFTEVWMTAIMHTQLLIFVPTAVYLYIRAGYLR